jgi:O-antigen/teichoic acid export membrane protein
MMLPNVIYYMLSLLLTSMFPFLLLPWLTNSLSTEIFGALALAEIMGTLTSSLSTQGLSLYYERTFFEVGVSEKKDELLQSLLYYSLSLVILFGGLVYLFESVIISNFFPSLLMFPGLITLVHFLASFRQLNQFFLSYFKCKESGQSYMYFQVSMAILINVLVIYFVVVQVGNVYDYILSQLSIHGLYFIISLFVLVKRSCFKLNVSYVVSALPYSLPLIPKMLMGVVVTHIDKYFLAYLSTVGNVGAYSVTQKFAFVIFLFMNMLSNIFTPKVYKKMFEGKSEVIRNAIGEFLTPFFYMSALLTLFLGIFSKEILLIFTAQDFHFAHPIIPILSFYYLILFFRKQNQLIFAKKTYILTIVSFFHIFFISLANYLLIKDFGILGAASSTLLIGVLETVVLVYFSQKFYKINYETYVLVLILVYIVIVFSSLVILDKIYYPFALLIKALELVAFLYYGYKFIYPKFTRSIRMME